MTLPGEETKSQGSAVDANSQERYVTSTEFENSTDQGSQEFVMGFSDAFVGIVRHPYLGATQEGPLGFVKGLGRGLGGFYCHSLAGESDP